MKITEIVSLLMAGGDYQDAVYSKTLWLQRKRVFIDVKQNRQGLYLKARR